MQLLYLVDAGHFANRPGNPPPEPDTLLEQTDPDHDPETVRRAAVELALAAWADHANADAHLAELAPDWPTHRQPPVDRAILRLAFYEIASGRSPASIAINEAVELAKAYGSDRSPPFINAVLDRWARARPADSQPTAANQPPAPTGDAWLSDAVEQAPAHEPKPRNPPA